MGAQSPKSQPGALTELIQTFMDSSACRRFTIAGNFSGLEPAFVKAF
jgi:hypothetical protein